MQYEIMVILTEDLTELELKIWKLTFIQYLTKLNADNILIEPQGKKKLKYSIKKKYRGNFIQLNFTMLPTYINQLLKMLSLDINILRFLLFNIDIE